MTYQHVTVHRQGAAMVVTLNRPEKLNAFNGAMGDDVERAFKAADADDDVRAIVLTGAGRAFCAGADVSGGASSFDTSGDHGAGVFSNRAGGRRGSGFVQAMFNSKKPSIVAINGPAVGVGVTMTLPCDIRIASDNAKFGFIFARRGLVPEAGSAWFLPRLVGLPQALRWSLSGRVFGAEEALAGGLVSEIVAPDALLDRALAIVDEIASDTSPVSVALTRQLLWRFAGAPDPFELLTIDGPLSIERGATADVKEGVQSFLEKRRPNFPLKVSADMPESYPWWRDDATD